MFCFVLIYVLHTTTTANIPLRCNTQTCCTKSVARNRTLAFYCISVAAPSRHLAAPTCRPPASFCLFGLETQSSPSCPAENSRWFYRWQVVLTWRRVLGCGLMDCLSVESCIACICKSVNTMKKIKSESVDWMKIYCGCSYRSRILCWWCHICNGCVVYLW